MGHKGLQPPQYFEAWGSPLPISRGPPSPTYHGAGDLEDVFAIPAPPPTIACDVMHMWLPPHVVPSFAHLLPGAKLPFCPVNQDFWIGTYWAMVVLRYSLDLLVAESPLLLTGGRGERQGSVWCKHTDEGNLLLLHHLISLPPSKQQQLSWWEVR